MAEEDQELGLTLEDTRLIKIAMTQCEPAGGPLPRLVRLVLFGLIW